jgi:NAD-dependent SIR2 family protein deacetylase
MSVITCHHIQLTLYCVTCSHQWDIEDYDSLSVDDAAMKAEDETCPRCDEDKEG